QPEALPQTFRGLLTSALGRDQHLDPLLKPVMLEASGACLKVLTQLLASLWGAFTIEQGPYLGDHFGATDVAMRVIVRAGVGWARKLAHDDTSSCACSPRTKPLSFATSANRPRS